ncbi:MAG: type IV pilin-like G/H family protein [Coleofasciculus sp. B1-GNL1-01]|uniref:type IV pilin-like G/H family protein n=1 Tax=Coleofasciculus sp. B1-GNL1-01 TaxID=3068484 RepID=UPI0032F29F75
MAQTPPEGDWTAESTATAKKNKLPLILWIFAGCGCLFLGLIILGIVSAIVLPSFLNQATKAKQAEAKKDIRSINRMQQMIYLETGTFARSIEELNLGISPETESYRYQIVTPQQIPGVMATAEAKESGLRSYTGVVFEIKENGENITINAICGTDQPSTQPPEIVVVPSRSEERLRCPAGSSYLYSIE